MKKLGLTILALLLVQFAFVANGQRTTTTPTIKSVILTPKKPRPSKAPGRNPQQPTATTVPFEAFIEGDAIIVRFLEEVEDVAIIIKDETGIVVYEEYASAPGEYTIEMEDEWSEIEVGIGEEWYWGEL